MPEFLNDPFLQSSLLPLLLSALLTGLLRWVSGRFGGAWAVAAPLGAFLLMFIWVIGLPAFPPPASMGKLFWLLVAGAVLALGLDAAQASRRMGAGLMALGAVAGLVWIAGAQRDTLLILSLIPLAGLAVAIAWGGRADDRNAGHGVLPLGVVALAWAAGLGGVALVGSSAALAQAGLSLAACLGGLLVWNWPRNRDHAPWAGRLLLVAPLPLATVLIFFTQANSAVLPILLLSPLAVWLVQRRLATRLGAAVGGIVLTIAALLPTVIAVGLAALLAANQSTYGY